MKTFRIVCICVFVCPGVYFANAAGPVGTYNGILHSNSGYDGTLSNWILRADGTTEGQWTMNTPYGTVVSGDASGTYTYSPGGQAIAQCWGTASLSGVGTDGYNIVLVLTFPVEDTYDMEGTYDTDFNTWVDDAGTCEGTRYAAPIADHVFLIEIDQWWDYEDPSDSGDLHYEFCMAIESDETIELVEFLAPSGQTFEIPDIYDNWDEVTQTWTTHEYDSEEGMWLWEYNRDREYINHLEDFGDGWYTITVYYDGGGQEQTHIWFGAPYADGPVGEVSQEPVLINPVNLGSVNSPVTFCWEPCTDAAATQITINLEEEQTGEELDESFELNETCWGSVMLTEGYWEAEVDFEAWYEFAGNSDGVRYGVGKHTESDYHFWVDTEAFSIDLSHFYYMDGAGREINYDFSSGTIDEHDIITIPESAIIQRATGEEGTIFIWEPNNDQIDNSLETGFCRMSIPEADISIPVIPLADITVDGDETDWYSIAPYVFDENTNEDDTSVDGSDIEYVKLAYSVGISVDGTRLNILIKVSDAVSQDVWYRMFFDHDVDEQVGKPGNYQVDFQYSMISWDVVSQGWYSEDGGDYYLVDEQGQAAVSGQFIEGSVDIDALGIDEDFYFLGRTMMAGSPYTQYDYFHAVENGTGGLSSLGAYGASSTNSLDWEFQTTINNFQKTNREQYYYGVEIGAGTYDSTYEDTSTQSYTPVIDGDPDDWDVLEPAILIAGDFYSGSPDADIQNVYTAIDSNNVYFMVETAAPLAGSEVIGVEINFNYKYGQHFGHDSYDDIHINVNLASETISARTGDYEPVVLSAVVEVGDVLEVAIPRSELDDEGYFNATFVNTWKSDSPSGQGEDPSWIDPVITPEVEISWFTGTYDGTYYDNALILKAKIDARIIDADSGELFLSGHDPATTNIDVKIEVENATNLTVSYKIAPDSWSTLWEHTIPEGRMLSFPSLFPYVEMRTGYLSIPGDFDYDGKVDLIDFAALSSAWMADLSSTAFYMRCDAGEPRDGVINIVDLVVFCDNWLEGAD